MTFRFLVRTFGRNNERFDSFSGKYARNGIQLKRSKLTFRRLGDRFRGHSVDVSATTDMKCVLHFNDMINHLSIFLPEVAEMMRPVGGLRHKAQKWILRGKLPIVFDHTEQFILTVPLVAYYDPTLPLCMQ